MIAGRDDEVALLESLLADARRSRTRRVALIGEGGIGKTTLLERVRSSASDMTALEARGVESEMEVPFGALLDLLRPFTERLAELPEPLARALRRALGLEAGDGGDRFAVGAGTLALLGLVAERSALVVLIDDLHWVDRPSREAILFAARRLDTDSIGVVVAMRDDAGVDRSELTGFELREVGGLTLAAAATIVGAARAAAAVLLTGGNPLALEHIRDDVDFDLDGTAMPVALPRRLAEHHERTLDPLPRGCRNALLVAAADDVGATVVIIRALALLTLTLDDLEPAESARLVRFSGGRLEFRHPLVRSAVYHTASPAERRLAHAALAQAHGEHGDDTRAAWHRAATAVGPDEDVARALERLGDGARDRAADATAARAYERAAVLSQATGSHGRRLLKAAGSAWKAGRATQAAELALRAAAAAGDADALAEAAMLWGRVATTIGVDPGEIADRLERDALGLASDRPLVASVMLAQASDRAYFGSGDVDRSQRLADQAEAVAAALPAPPRRVRQGVAWHMIRRGDCARGVELMKRVLAETLADGDRDAATLLEASYLAIWSGDLAAALALARRAERDARERTDVALLPEILGTLGELQMRGDGDWNSALAMVAEGVALAEETGQALTGAYVSATYAEFCAIRGDVERARNALVSVAAFRRIRVWCDIGVAYVESLLASTAGDFERALAPFPPASRAFDTWWGLETERIEALAHLGRIDEARAAIAAATNVMTMPFARARLDRCRGLVAERDGYREPLGRSIAAFEHQRADVERARSELCLGERLRRDGQRVAAREHLRAALSVFNRAGTRPWADRARRELAASGERRRPVTGPDDELTPRERQIAQLAAEGRTNREIASIAFLSPKTIEAHLGRVFRKLGVSARADLAAVLEASADQRTGACSASQIAET